MRWWWWCLLLFVASACSGTRSSSIATGEARPAYRGVVRITSVQPTQGTEVGLVAVESVESLPQVVEELQRRAAELGADVATVDRYTTSYHMETRTSTQSYQCGTSTCTQQVTSTVQVETLHLQGRAFNTRGN